MNSLLANSILDCKSLVGASDLPAKKLSYLQDLFLGKTGTFVSALVYLIRSVVCASPKKKMVGINASPVIALMKDAHSFWDWSVVHDPRDSMSRVRVVSPSVCDSSISKRRNGARPLPAVVGLVYFRPESFSERFWFRSFCHLSGLPLIRDLV